MILTPENVVWLREKNCVLLDGAFDPLHAGHIRYFTEAIKAFPSHLKLVAVASDDDIRAKGREPLLDQQTRCAVVQAAMGGGYAIAKDGPTEHLIGRLKPSVYAKGKDWEGKLPAEQLAACSLNNVEIVYLDTVKDSSSTRLREWAIREADRGVDRLEVYMAKQKPASEPWRPVTDYSFEARKVAEGRHPELIKDVFRPSSVLDAGCGPDGHLIRLLREIGVNAEGFDVQERRADDLRIWRGDIAGRVNECGTFDLVISRECLEHLTVRQISVAVRNLCRLSSRFVYGTTRFNPSPRHMLDFSTEFDVDPTHISCGTHAFLRMLFALEGFRWRGDLAARMDWLGRGRTFCFERTHA